MEKYLKIEAVCISEKKGTAKSPVDEAVFIENYGIKGDAHAGKWHRQISLLSVENIDEFRKAGANVDFGDFGENLVTSGADPAKIPVGSRLVCGDIILEITQIGKSCHSDCIIRQKTGDCIMPKKGTFAVVISGGHIRPGDEFEIESPNPNRPYTAAVITVSDRSYNGLRKDLSGPACMDFLTETGFNVIDTRIVPDEKEMIKDALTDLADRRQVNLIITNGGTGFSVRDVTPEATMDVMTRNVPGIAEAIRAESAKYTDKAMLSRGVSVIRGNSLIINLPGSPKAAGEALGAVINPVKHGLGILLGRETN